MKSLILCLKKRYVTHDLNHIKKILEDAQKISK